MLQRFADAVLQYVLHILTDGPVTVHRAENHTLPLQLQIRRHEYKLLVIPHKLFPGALQYILRLFRLIRTAHNNAVKQNARHIVPCVYKPSEGGCKKNSGCYHAERR